MCAAQMRVPSQCNSKTQQGNRQQLFEYQGKVSIKGTYKKLKYLQDQKKTC